MKKLDSHFLGLGEFPALVVVDMCKAFIDPSSPLGFECSKLIDANVKLVQEFRNRNFPIFFTTTMYRNESEASVFRKKIPALNILKPNSNEVSFLEELSPTSNEVLIEKKFASAFFQTNLFSILVHDISSGLVHNANSPASVVGNHSAMCIIIEALEASDTETPVKVNVVNAARWNVPT